MSIARGGQALVVAAGTSDLPVVREALLVARHLGRPADLVVDVGVADLRRILGRLEQICASTSGSWLKVEGVFGIVTRQGIWCEVVRQRPGTHRRDQHLSSGVREAEGQFFI